MHRGTMVAAAVAAISWIALPAHAAGTFVDDDGSVHEPNIEAVAAEGITKGCNPPVNDRFCPDDPVSRGQMAAFLVRAKGYTARPAADPFVDDDSSVFEADIERLAEAGVTKGCNPPVNDMFCPGDPVTRAQMAAFLVRAFGYVDGAGSDVFVDDDSSVFEADIERLAEAGVTKGCNPPVNDMFCPDGLVTRAEMATFLARALNLDPIQPLPFDPPWYQTPSPVGIGARVVTPGPGASSSLANALADARPGDLIQLGNGTYHALGNLVLRNSGTTDRWIGIQAAPGSHPVIDLDGVGELQIAASYVLLDGIEIVDGAGNNLHIAPESESVRDVIVRDMHIHSLRSGPGAAIKINRNNAFSAGVSRVYVESSDLSGPIENAIVDGVGVEMSVVRDSWIHDNDPGSHGIFFKGGSSDILIERNLVSHIVGNAALQLGGNTGIGFFDPVWVQWEGVDQTARNNIIADFDDSAVEVRGVLRGNVYHNTIVGQSSFAIFRLSCGNTDNGGQSGNDQIEIVNNLVIGEGDAQYARNDCGDVAITFGPQGWFGSFHNSGTATPGIPLFPRTVDTWSVSTTGVVTDPSWSGLSAIATAVDRFTPVEASSVLGAGDPAGAIVPQDILQIFRSPSAPTLGAVE